MRITIEVDGTRLRPYAVAAILLGVMGIPIWAYASNVTIPFTFVNGQTADANDVNANFSAVAVAVNDNSARIGSLTTLQTATQTSLVAAINEVDGRTYSSHSDFAVFNTPGTFQFTVPQGVSQILIEVWGGGGGASEPSAGIVAPGGGGGYGKDFLGVGPGQVLSIVVGSGGASGIAGSNGGTTHAILSSSGFSLDGGGGTAGGSNAGGGGGGSNARFSITGSNGQFIPNTNCGLPGSAGLGSAGLGANGLAPGEGGCFYPPAGLYNGQPGRVVIWY